MWTRKEVMEQYSRIQKKIEDLQDELLDLEGCYEDYLLESNGYKYGDILKDKHNEDCMVKGAEFKKGKYYLKCCKLKKNGTPSETQTAKCQYELKYE